MSEKFEPKELLTQMKSFEEFSRNFNSTKTALEVALEGSQIVHGGPEAALLNLTPRLIELTKDLEIVNGKLMTMWNTVQVARRNLELQM